MRHRLRLVCLLGAAVPPAAAQESPPERAWVLWRDPGPPPPAPWEFQAELGAWYAAPAGRLRFAGSSDSVDVKNVNLDSPRVSPSVEAHLNVGSWRLTVSAFSFDTDGRGATAEQTETIGGILISPGDRTESSLSVASGQVSAAYPLVSVTRTPLTAAGTGVGATVGGVLGARFYTVSSDIRATDTMGVSRLLSGDEFFAEPFAGVKGELLIADWLTLDLETTFGGLTGVTDGSSYSWDIAVGLHARPAENMGVQLGYRQLVMHLNADDEDGFEFAGSLAGLYAGLVVRF